ncbi:MAG: hypothetical protein ACOCYZ_00515 [Halococcoides sp.]
MASPAVQGILPRSVHDTYIPDGNIDIHMKAGEIVVAGGALGVLIGAALLTGTERRWSLVLLQFAIGYLVVGAVATYERKRGLLDHRRLLAALSVPGVVTGVLVVALLATRSGSFNIYPYETATGIYVLWAVPAAIVPHVYALGRSIDVRYEWGLVGLAGLLPAIPVASYSAAVAPFLLDAEQSAVSAVIGLRTVFGSELAAASLTIAFGFWMAIVPYTLGRRIAPDPKRSRALVALAALGAVAPVVLSAAASGPVIPQRLGEILLATILYGPLVCVGVWAVWIRHRASGD